MNEAEQKAVELLKAVLLKFYHDFHFEPKSFLITLIKYFNSGEQKRKSEGFNYRVCLKVFEEMYPE